MVSSLLLQIDSLPSHVVVVTATNHAELLDRAVRTGRLTGRGFDRVLRLALTTADLAGRDRPSAGDLATALALRCGESM